MILILRKERGMVQNQEFVKMLSDLEDGRYAVKVIRINEEKTLRDYQEQYFANLDIIVNHTGHGRYDIHDQFKLHENIETTKNLSEVEWVTLLDQLKWWAFKEFDIIL